MKKMKGVVGASGSLPYGVYEDAKTRIKHQSLMQEFQELHKETEVMRNKLQSTKQKKLTLLAEVRFLRRKFENLMQNRTKKSRPEQHHVQAQRQPPQISVIQGKNVKKGRKHNSGKEAALHSQITSDEYNRKGRKHSGKEAALHSQVTSDEYNRKERIHSGKEAALRNPVPSFELDQKERLSNWKGAPLRNPDTNVERRIYNGKGGGFRNPTPVFDLNERIDKGKEVATRNPVPVFDLNQISGEEVEFQAYSEPMKVEEPKKCLINSVVDEQQNDMKLSVCRNLGNGAKRAGKRKISWQDQVALRV